MSNATLKEQLQTLGLSVPAKTESRPKKTKPQAGKAGKSLAQPQPHKPAWLEQAQYGVELLKAYFPNCFKDIKEIEPLKKGIKQDLVKHLSTCEDIVIGDKACMVNSLAYYVNSPAYHKKAVEGAVRVDLKGEPAGVVTAEEANYSSECRKAKQQKSKSTTNTNSNSQGVVAPTISETEK